MSWYSHKSFTWLNNSFYKLIDETVIRVIAKEVCGRKGAAPIVRTTLVVVMMAAAGNAVAAANVSCPQFFAGGMPPQVLSANPQGGTSAKLLASVFSSQPNQTLCYGFFALLESSTTRTPFWSAEHLTRDSVARAHDEVRHDAFHAESALSPDVRAELSDYRATGYDRGHMSPSGDMPDAATQEESFSLANMVPQAPDNNRHLWQGIEIATRAFAKADGELYVVTGPLFLDSNTLPDGRVRVPTHIWKAIFDPSRGAAAYVSANKPGDGYAVISIDELKALTGIDPFPALADAVKSKAMALPTPRPSGRKMKTGAVTLAQLGIEENGANRPSYDATVDVDTASSSPVSRNQAPRRRYKPELAQAPEVPRSAGVLAGDTPSQQRHERDVAARIDAWLTPLRDAIKPWFDKFFAYLQHAI